MSQPSNRAEFKEYILRKCGHPVIQINVSDEQIEDRIDEAIAFWRDYHYDGSQMIYLKHSLTQQEIDQGYIEVPENILGVTRIFDLSSSISTGTGFFNVQYQFVLNNLEDITGYNIQHYYMSLSHLQFLQEILVGRPLVRYNRHVNRLYLDVTKSILNPGSFIIIEGYDIIDGTTYSDVWQDRFLQNYASTLIREQWGLNLTKFSGMQLVGGVQFNGERILDDARAERKEMEDMAKTSLQPLVYNWIG